MKSNSKSKKFCDHFGVCSGCQIDINIYFPPIWNEVIDFFNNKGLSSVPFYSESRLFWRNRAKLAVRGTSRNPLIGLFKQGSHSVIPIPFCQIHYPEINQSIEIIKKWIIKNNLLPYNEIDASGELRYLQFVVERESKKVQAVFVLNFNDLSSEKAKKWEALIKSLGDNDQENHWHSLWINLNSNSTNTIFGSQWIHCFGNELLWEKFEHVSVCYLPSSFAQANLNLFEKMLSRIKELIGSNTKIAEFYAGVGVIGLYLTSKSEWIRCVEINPNAEYCFLRSRALFDSVQAEKITFYSGSAQSLLNILDGANTAIVDPPRKGLDLAVLRCINEANTLKSLFYISCGWDSFKRDCDQLIEAGWKLSLAEGYLFFPGSHHIEILAKFEKI